MALSKFEVTRWLKEHAPYGQVSKYKTMRLTSLTLTKFKVGLIIYVRSKKEGKVLVTHPYGIRVA